MITRRSVRLLVLLCVGLAGSTLGFSSLQAQSVAVGTIEGRVSNPTNGSYLESARVSREGTVAGQTP